MENHMLFVLIYCTEEILESWFLLIDFSLFLGKGIHRPLRSYAKYRLILEDLKVLKRSPDILNNIKISQGQLKLR